VDLLWRTGAEQRTSNFLPWHSTYAELFFTTSLWPDVDRRDLWDAIAEYARRRRRYGAATGQEPLDPGLPQLADDASASNTRPPAGSLRQAPARRR